MADASAAAATGFDAVLGAISDLLKTGASPEILEAQRLLLRRLALEGDVLPSRVPAPRNITEVGGYINLLTTLGQSATRAQMLASALGVAGATQTSLLDDEPVAVPLVSLVNDRPVGAAQPSIPPSLQIRADFAPALKAALDAVRAAGCAVPLMAQQPVLSRVGQTAPSGDDLLRLLGRRLDLVPLTLLADADQDALAVAVRQNDPPTTLRLTAREADGGTKVPDDQWLVLTCSAAACQLQPAAARRLRPIEPDLANAGWYLPTPTTAPTTLTAMNAFRWFRNVTGLLIGSTTLGSELALLYSPRTVADSSLADRQGWIWNGEDFAAA